MTRWFRDRFKWGELDKWKAIVEIIAIVFTGTWTFYEFSFKEREAERRRESYGWVSVDLTASAAPLTENSYVLHATVHMNNTSKRPVVPLFVSWIVLNPSESDEAKRYLPVKNSAADVDMSPGEEVRQSATFVVPATFRAAIVRAKIYMRTEDFKEICMIDPVKHPPPFDIETYTDVPSVCVRDEENKAKCAPPPNPCSLQRSEVLVKSPFVDKNGDGT